MARRTSLSYEQQRDVWGRWKRGECMADIARALAVSRDPVQHILVSAGGIARRRDFHIGKVESGRQCAVALQGLQGGDDPGVHQRVDVHG